MRPRLLLAALACLALSACLAGWQPFVILPAEPADRPWWQRTAYRPFGFTLYGLPVRNIDHEWCAANTFTAGLFPDGLLDTPPDTALAATGTAFAVELRPEGQRRLIAMVGAFTGCRGRHGLFLLVLDDPQSAVPSRIYLEQWDQPGFAVLGKLDERSFELRPCTRCAPTATLTWDPESGTFTRQPPGR
jgi:hypothetical protein